MDTLCILDRGPVGGTSKGIQPAKLRHLQHIRPLTPPFQFPQTKYGILELPEAVFPIPHWPNDFNDPIGTLPGKRYCCARQILIQTTHLPVARTSSDVGNPSPAPARSNPHLPPAEARDHREPSAACFPALRSTTFPQQRSQPVPQHPSIAFDTSTHLLPLPLLPDDDTGVSSGAAPAFVCPCHIDTADMVSPTIEPHINFMKTRTCIHTPGYPPMVPNELSSSKLCSALNGSHLVYLDGRLHETALVVAEEGGRPGAYACACACINYLSCFASDQPSGLGQVAGLG
ncbi:hypothetical protein KSP40_PGU012505 [Platanthera guangdongensis]|uniref:Uncharacterized protein n=1 Tax=Platanthera guangdongensis TaxID=2320717 RepID=A0ABR2LQ49_9ASPA